MKNDQSSQTTSRLTAIFIIAGSVVLMVVVCLIATQVMLHRYAQKRPMQSMRPLGIVTAPDEQPLTHLPAPHLELDDGHKDFTALHEQQVERLNNYGWIDRSNKIARIPIERAMDLIVSRGLPVTTNLETMTGALQIRSNVEGGRP